VRFLVISIVAAAVLAVAAGASAAPAKDNFQLKGEVYGNSLFKIEMENKAGRKLRTVKAGTYRIKVEDKATIHNFRLRGPGVNKATSVPGRAETIWTVRLRKGTYTFLCDPHASSMRGSFRVT
jgi:plastocyanin